MKEVCGGGQKGDQSVQCKHKAHLYRYIKCCGDMNELMKCVTEDLNEKFISIGYP